MSTTGVRFAVAGGSLVPQIWGSDLLGKPCSAGNVSSVWISLCSEPVKQAPGWQVKVGMMEIRPELSQPSLVIDEIAWRYLDWCFPW